MWLLDKIYNFLTKPVLDAIRSSESKLLNQKNHQIQQKNLSFQYRQMLKDGLPMPRFEDVGFRVFSENDEDGILLYIFSVVGVKTKKLVDIGAAVGGSNTANLIVNHGWTGLLIEGEEARAKEVHEFYKTCPDTRNYPPKIVSEWVTRDNIDSLLARHGMYGEIDLLSIDIDGVDYYIWQAINCISPRVVVVEFQCIWGPEKSVSVPYSDYFKGGFVGPYGVYSGASLAAFVKLAKRKSYRLVGCHRYGYNAFFVRNDVCLEILPEIAPEECFRHPFTQWAQKELLPKVKNLEWVEI